VSVKITLKKPLWFTVITTLCLVVVTLFAATSCDKIENPDAAPSAEPIYPITIETTNFPLHDWSCWANLEFDIIHVFNSEEELRQYFTCKIAVDIDFANYSLIVFSPKYCNIHSKVEKLLLQQLSANKYLLSVDIEPSMTAIPTLLIVSVLVPKIAETADIELKLTIGHPIEVPFTEYSLEETLCKWKLSQEILYELITINNNEELENYIECVGESNYPEIDFSKYTLLLAHGKTGSPVIYQNCNISLQQFLKQNYEMRVDLSLGIATVMSYWQVPIVINKLSEGCAIELIVTIK